MTHSLRILTATFAVTLLAACGGGGGSPATTGLERFASLSQHNELNANTLTVARTAAGTNEAAGDASTGDVTQASTATDRADVEIDFSDTGERSYEMQTGEAASLMTFLDSDSDGVTTIRLGRPYGASSLGENGEVVILHDEADKTALIANDAQDADDNDYIVWGIWADTPDETEATNFRYGAFADAIDSYIYAQNNIIGLTGDATYAGHAIGAALTPGQGTASGSTNTFLADVTLTAAFGGTQTLGTVSGTVDNFRFQNGAGPVSGVTLMPAIIGPDADSGGFFKSTTSAIMGDMAVTGAAGHWGGKFYGRDPAAGADPDYPDSVAGTFGVTVADGFALLGAYKADVSGAVTATALPDYPVAAATARMHAGVTSVPTAMTNAEINSVLRMRAAGADTLQGSDIFARRGQDTRTVPVTCSGGRTCDDVTIPGLTLEFSLDNIGNSYTTNFPSLTGVNEAAELVMEDRGVTVYQIRAAGRQGDATTHFSTYGGWLDNSAFSVDSISLTTSPGDTSIFLQTLSYGVNSGSNPTAGPGDGGILRWNGLMAGADTSNSNQTVQGDAVIAFETATSLVNVQFDNIRDLSNGNSVPSMMWSDLTLTDGAFSSTSTGTIEGSFYEADHSEVGGTFVRNNIFGAFGAERQ